MDTVPLVFDSQNEQTANEPITSIERINKINPARPIPQKPAEILKHPVDPVTPGPDPRDTANCLTHLV
jgi:hypothetical protein